MTPRNFLLFICALAFCFMQTEQALACMCRAPATTAEAFKRSTSVFRGRVVKISIPSLDWIGLTRTGAHRVKFEIVKQWKGPSSETAVVVTRLTAEGCGFLFEEHKEYLVFVIAEQKHVQTGICTGTKDTADAEQEMQELDQLIGTPNR
jgi:hypothetical protein